MYSSCEESVFDHYTLTNPAYHPHFPSPIWPKYTRVIQSLSPSKPAHSLLPQHSTWPPTRTPQLWAFPEARPLKRPLGGFDLNCWQLGHPLIHRRRSRVAIKPLAMIIRPPTWDFSWFSYGTSMPPTRCNDIIKALTRMQTEALANKDIK